MSTCPSWADPATSCLNAYIKREYAVCASAGQAALATNFLPTVGPVTILALHRLGRTAEAEDLGNKLLLRSFGMNGTFLMQMRLIDGDLEPEQCLQNQNDSVDDTSTKRDNECEIYFYCGAKLLTDGKLTQAFRPLLLATWADGAALERELANADLRTVRERLLAAGEFSVDGIDREVERILAERPSSRTKR